MLKIIILFVQCRLIIETPSFFDQLVYIVSRFYSVSSRNTIFTYFLIIYIQKIRRMWILVYFIILKKKKESRKQYTNSAKNRMLLSALLFFFKIIQTATQYFRPELRRRIAVFVSDFTFQRHTFSGSLKKKKNN